MRSGPHHTTTGNREFRQVLTVVLRLCGHWSTGPSGVAVQSNARLRAPNSPPPANTSFPTSDSPADGSASAVASCILGPMGLNDGIVRAPSRATKLRRAALTAHAELTVLLQLQGPPRE